VAQAGVRLCAFAFKKGTQHSAKSWHSQNPCSATLAKKASGTGRCCLCALLLAVAVAVAVAVAFASQRG
jgi:hypothetical protein